MRGNADQNNSEYGHFSLSELDLPSPFASKSYSYNPLPYFFVWGEIFSLNIRLMGPFHGKLTE